MDETYCIAKFEEKENNVVCYEHNSEGTKRLMQKDRFKRENECRYCPQLTRAIDRMLNFRGWI